MALSHQEDIHRRAAVRPHHVFLPSVPIPCVPVPGHVNHIKPSSVPDTERTFQVDIDGDGLIGSPR